MGMVWGQSDRVALGARGVPGGDNGEDAAGGSAVVALGGSSGGHMLRWQWGRCIEGLVQWRWGEALRSPRSGGRGALGVCVGAAVVAVGRSRAPRCGRAMGSSEEACFGFGEGGRDKEGAPPSCSGTGCWRIWGVQWGCSPSACIGGVAFAVLLLLRVCAGGLCIGGTCFLLCVQR